jgi:hypothetical protein
MRHTFAARFAPVCLLLATTALANEPFLTHKNFNAGDLKVTGLIIPAPTKVHITAVGVLLPHSDDFNGYGWIIDANTRELVWIMDAYDSDRIRGEKGLRSVEADETLRAGKYEVYYWCDEINTWGFNYSNDNDESGFFSGFFRFFDENTNDVDLKDSFEKCNLAISVADGASGAGISTYEVSSGFPDALISLTRLGDTENLTRGFQLTKPSTLRIYSVFEGPENYESAVDVGWIADATDRKRVWELTTEDADWAGGGKKNRVYDQEIELPAGKYVLHFMTDDSHSYEDFNVTPPIDPINWGITILPGKSFDRSAFQEFEPVGRGKALVNLTRVRDGDEVSQAFKLNKPSKIIVYAIGEYSQYNREFVDYGWIESARTGEMVWTMSRANTTHAGGGHKNRMADEELSLPAGEYVVHFVTDDSHAYKSWNAGAPGDARNYGISIYPGTGFKEADLTRIEEDDVKLSGDILARIIRVHDDEERTEEFTLTKETAVHIYALGEGDGGTMADYGWIEDLESGRTVWEMTYRNTRAAGGASKNRLSNQTINLPAGKYAVTFVTDGSHAYNSWNATKPKDASSWGITLSVTP